MSDVAATRGDPRALPGARRGAARRRLGAAAQHGHDRRQPAAAHALPATSATPAFACNKRAPGSRLRGARRREPLHAILGTSDHCVATHPSDLAVALAALDAEVAHCGAGGRARDPRSSDFYLLPGDTPERETVLEHGELITAIELPPLPCGAALALPEGARPRLLRVRARLGRGRARPRRRPRPRRAHRAGRRRRPSRGAPAAVEAALRGQPLDERTLRRGRRRGRRGRDAAAATTRSRSSWPAARCARALA